jgi:hypothetical protein
MTHLARHWRCPRCGWRHTSPIPVVAIGCPHHKGAPLAMKPDEDNEE